MSTQPTIFIASSSSAINMVKALKLVFEQEGLIVDAWMEPEGWKSYPLTDLLKRANKCDYCVCVIWPDDELKSPTESGATHLPRDNVVFEAGLFTGVLNREFWHQPVTEEKRVYYWLNKLHGRTVHRPTDLKGLNEERYSYKGDVKNDAILTIKSKIEPEAQALARTILTHWQTLSSAATAPSPIQKTILRCFQREWIIEPPKPPHLSYDSKRRLFDVDEVYDSFVCEGENARSAIIADRDTRWIWDLFPLVLHWRRSGVPLTVVAPPNADRHDQKRRQLLVGLGCNLVIAQVSEPLFVVNPGLQDNTRAFRFENTRHCCATLISRREEPGEMDLLDKRLALFGPIELASTYKPQIVSANESEIREKLTSDYGPDQYRSSGVHMEMDEIELKQAGSISMAVRTYRFRQTPLLVKALLDNGIELFNPAKVILSNGESSLITPPVVEKNKEGLVFIEGNTRALHSFCEDKTHIRCLVVTGVREKPPATKTPLNEVFLCRLKLPAAWRQMDWDYSAFRDIEGAIHNH